MLDKQLNQIDSNTWINVLNRIVCFIEQAEYARTLTLTLTLELG